MVKSSVLAFSVVLVLVISVSYVYLWGFDGAGSPGTSATTSSSFSNTSVSTSTVSKMNVLEIQIPPHSTVPPPGFNVTNLLTGSFRYLFNYTVVIGVNNTIRWVNKDFVDHTASSFVVPSGAEQFNSGLIKPNGTYSTVLAVPGVYKYTCIWHPFLAGEIRVMAATQLSP